MPRHFRTAGKPAARVAAVRPRAVQVALAAPRGAARAAEVIRIGSIRLTRLAAQREGREVLAAAMAARSRLIRAAAAGRPAERPTAAMAAMAPAPRVATGARATAGLVGL